MALYLVALKRMLEVRLNLPEGTGYKAIGGAVYCFLRGIDRNARGTYFERPKDALIECLDDFLKTDSVANSWNLVPKEQFEMISQNQNSFENLGTILLDLLTRRGKTITEELRDALAFFMLHLGQAEHLGGLCAELDATPQIKSTRSCSGKLSC